MLLDLLVHPGVEVEALGGSLYLYALEQLASYAPAALAARVREDWHAWLEFYGSRGFSESERMWESRLEVQGFDPTPFMGALERASSITFVTLAELPDNERTQRRLYNVLAELLRDVPFSEPLSIWPFERWRERYWASPTRHPEGHFLAFWEDELIGVSELRKGARPDWLYTGLTGVTRANRRRGVARALKLNAVLYAKERGVRVISTQNHTNNRPMLAINEAMGFLKQPAWVRLKKPLG